MRSVIMGLAPSRLIIAGLFLAAFGLLAACGTAQGPGPQVPSCGELTLPLASGTSFAASVSGQRVKAVEQCFVDTYHQCKARSLLLIEHGTDTGTKWTFAIAPHESTCQIDESVDDYSANFGGSDRVTTGTCQGLTETTGALVLVQCQGQDISIPRAEACGDVSSYATPPGVKLAESCFAEDYQLCYPAELNYDESDMVGDIFRLDASCQLTLVQNNMPAILCASLTQEADGLHIMGCGNQDTILVPAHP